MRRRGRFSTLLCAGGGVTDTDLRGTATEDYLLGAIRSADDGYGRVRIRIQNQHAAIICASHSPWQVVFSL
jgi:hypothetical protein